MPYVKRPSGGTKVEFNTTTADEWVTGPFTQIPGVTGDITLPGGTPAKIDITTHDDVITYGGWRQNGAGLADTADPSFEILLDPDDTVHQGLLADVSARTVRNYKFTFPGGVTTIYGVRGQIGVGNVRAELNGYLRATVTILANKVNFEVTGV